MGKNRAVDQGSLNRGILAAWERQGQGQMRSGTLGWPDVVLGGWPQLSRCSAYCPGWWYVEIKDKRPDRVPCGFLDHTQGKDPKPVPNSDDATWEEPRYPVLWVGQRTIHAKEWMKIAGRFSFSLSLSWRTDRSDWCERASVSEGPGADWASEVNTGKLWKDVRIPCKGMILIERAFCLHICPRSTPFCPWTARSCSHTSHPPLWTLEIGSLAETNHWEYISLLQAMNFSHPPSCQKVMNPFNTVP